MVSLIVLVFTVQLIIHLVNTIGAQTLNELLWRLSARLPLPSSQRTRDQLRLKREVVRLKREMNAISAQDDFAKWAKARREHDKVLAEHNEVASQVQASRSSFDTAANILRWVSTSGLRFFLNWWYGKVPVYQIPQGWFPWQVEWILGFPRCPYGGVSINVWSAACATVISLAADGVSLALSQPADESNQKMEPKVPMAAEKRKQ